MPFFLPGSAYSIMRYNARLYLFESSECRTLQLRLHNLGCERDERVLFSALSAEFKAGDIVQIVGANGAGKTTLLRCICGLTTHYQGEVSWRGADDRVASNRDYDFVSSVLYLGHAPGLNSSLSAMENLAWFFGLCGFQADDLAHIPEDSSQLVTKEELKAALAKTGMSAYEDLPCRMLSAGQQRRVSLARIYCSNAPLWLLDEPFTAIDKAGVVSLEQRFEEHRQRGGIILLTSHQTLNIKNLHILDLAACAGATA